MRTIAWAANEVRTEFLKICKNEKIAEKERPYILGVVQGGQFQDLRKYCARELAKIGFDGFGYGGWPITEEGKFDMETAKTIAENTPKGLFSLRTWGGKARMILPPARP